MERFVFIRLTKFLENNNILIPNQYGFHNKLSTEFAIADVVNFVSDAIESKKFSVGSFLDLSKAFDSFDHNILLHKLHNYGVRGIDFNWFSSYLKIVFNMFVLITKHQF